MGDRTCSVDGCVRKFYGRGWCQLHYKRVRNTGTTDPRVSTPRACKVEGCDRTANIPGSARGWCPPHYQRWQRYGDPLGAHQHEPVVGIAACAVAECAELVRARGWCVKHYSRFVRFGEPEARLRGEVRNGCRVCPKCGADKPLAQYGGGRVYCLPCSAARTAEYRVQNPYAPRGEPANCQLCDQSFLANKRRYRYCSPECSAARKNPDNWKHYNARKARLREAFVEFFDRLEIFERDNWICQICLTPVDREAKFPNPSSVSLDHIVPIARGGKHSRANAQTACLGCNVRKGDRVA